MDAYRGKSALEARRGLPRGLAGGLLQALGWAGAVFAWAVATALGAVVACVLAAGVLVIALLAVAPLAVAAAAMRASRQGARPSDPDVLEARHVGGHSWVAYAADARR